MSAAASLPLFPHFFSATLAETDPEIAKAIDLELGRQQHEIELIASENIVSKAVLEAQGSVLTNKYAEGYPGKRYYGGCEYVDVTEQLAIDRACELFGATYANVQPIAAIPKIRELNIGHYLIGEAIFVGLEASVTRMRELMDAAR